MTGRWLTTLEEFRSLAADWDAAVAASGTDNPFLLSEFLLAWGEAFAELGEPRILVCESAGGIEAGLPLFLSSRRHARLHWQALRYFGLGFANLTEPFFPSGQTVAFAEAAGAALRRLHGWSYASLPLSRSRWAEAADLRVRCASRGSLARICVNCDAVAYAATRRPRMQADLRRCIRRAAETGAITFGREPDHLDDLIRIQLRFNGPFRYASEFELGASTASWAAFTEALLRRLAATGHLDPVALRIGGELAAAGFGFRYGSGYKSLLASFDPRFRTAGPGMLFFYHLVDWCHQRGDPTIEMYADGEEFEKRRWGNEFVPLHQLWIFAPTLSGRALHQGSRWA